MQSTKDPLGNDSALLRGFDAPRYWSVVIKRLMRARSGRPVSCSEWLGGFDTPSPTALGTYA